MTKFKGTNGEDTIEGTGGDDSIDGRGGSDYLYGLGGDDQLKGGAGDDHLDGGLGSDTVKGGDGTDYIVDTLGGSDRLFGEDGNDSIRIERLGSAASGEVRADGGAGEDDINFDGHTSNTVRAVLSGGADNDQLRATRASNVTMDGGEGDDFLSAHSSSNVVMKGGAGDDQAMILYGRSTNYVVDMGEGDDEVYIETYYLFAATYDLTLGTGQDTIILSNQSNATVTYLEISDFETGAAGDRLDFDAYLTSVLTGWGGENPFGSSGYLKLVQSGSDTLLQIDTDGGANSWQTLITFEDVLASSFTAENLDGFNPNGSSTPGQKFKGTNGEDTIEGTGGDDSIDGRGGSDYLYGLGGDDQLKGGAGDDHLDGGLGSDTVKGGDGTDYIVDTLGGSDRLFGEDGNDSIRIERLGSAASGEVRADGGAGEDDINFDGHTSNTVRAVLSGGADNDQLRATRASNVTMDGGEGDDFLSAHSSSNVVMKGGAGDDQAMILYGRSTNYVVDMGEGDDEVYIETYYLFAATYDLTLGTGQDTIILSNQSNATVTYLEISDFETGAAGDRLDFDAYLTSVLTGWGGENPFGSSGYLKLVQSGSDTLLQIDTDGGANSWQTLITFEDVLASSFTAENFNGFPPDGSEAVSVWLEIPSALDWMLS